MNRSSCIIPLESEHVHSAQFNSDAFRPLNEHNQQHSRTFRTEMISVRNPRRRLISEISFPVPSHNRPIIWESGIGNVYAHFCDCQRNNIKTLNSVSLPYQGIHKVCWHFWFIPPRGSVHKWRVQPCGIKIRGEKLHLCSRAAGESIFDSSSRSENAGDNVKLRLDSTMPNPMLPEKMIRFSWMNEERDVAGNWRKRK